MTSQTPDDSKLIAAMNAAKAKAEKLADYHAAIGGHERGRTLPKIGRNAESAEASHTRKHQDAIEFLTNLQALLADDPEYAKLYNDTKDLLHDAEKAAEAALAKAERHLNDIVERAAKLPDGRAVFQDKYGNVRTEDGAIVDAAIADGIIFSGDEPSFEDYRAARERIDDIRGYQVDVLGNARDGLENEDNPPTKQRLEEIQEDMQNGLNGIVYHDDKAAKQPAPAHQQLSSELGVPEL